MTIKPQNNNTNSQREPSSFAGGCRWGVQEVMKHLPGVQATEAGRANGSSNTTNSSYDCYTECVKVSFDTNQVNLNQLIGY
jgi:peptide-methionine (S)-S-oxide reductase